MSLNPEGAWLGANHPDASSGEPAPSQVGSRAAHSHVAHKGRFNQQRTSSTIVVPQDYATQRRRGCGSLCELTPQCSHSEAINDNAALRTNLRWHAVHDCAPTLPLAPWKPPATYPMLLDMAPRRTSEQRLSWCGAPSRAPWGLAVPMDLADLWRIWAPGAASQLRSVIRITLPRDAIQLGTMLSSFPPR